MNWFGRSSSRGEDKFEAWIKRLHEQRGEVHGGEHGGTGEESRRLTPPTAGSADSPAGWSSDWAWRARSPGSQNC